MNLKLSNDSESIMDHGLFLKEKNESLISILRNRRKGIVDGENRNNSITKKVK